MVLFMKGKLKRFILGVVDSAEKYHLCFWRIWGRNMFVFVVKLLMQLLLIQYSLHSYFSFPFSAKYGLNGNHIVPSTYKDFISKSIWSGCMLVKNPLCQQTWDLKASREAELICNDREMISTKDAKWMCVLHEEGVLIKEMGKRSFAVVRWCWTLRVVIVANHQQQWPWPCFCQEMNSPSAASVHQPLWASHQMSSGILTTLCQQSHHHHHHHQRHQHHHHYHVFPNKSELAQLIT